MSVQLAAQDFMTPNKGDFNKMSAASMESSAAFPASREAASTTTVATKAKSVTPTDNNQSQKKAAVSVSNSSSNVGGNKQVRFGAEGKASSSESPANGGNSSSKRGLVSRRGGRFVSPGRPITSSQASSTFRTPTTAKGNDTPGLSSTSSVGIVSLPSESEKDTPKRSVKNSTEGKQPSSISCDPSSLVNITSPLAKASPHKEMMSSFDVQSPVPSSSTDRFKKTPTKSPGQFHSLPSLDDSKLGSPAGFLMSPGPSTPSKKVKSESEEDKETREYAKEKFALTPTNFSMDYGKSPRPGIFDTSNVLNWLQSPTANGLFSPGGGLNSIMNTPKGPIVPRTPGSPMVSSSFFFSDVAGLPRTGDTPKRSDAEAVKSSKKGMSNIICISPLASSRNRNGNSIPADTPINYSDVFASPNPLLDDTPVKSRLAKRPTKGQRSGSGSDPSLDAVHQLAERDLMQDEDLSVLLQLAGGNTPKGAAGGKGVFRGSGARKDGDGSNLQLPVIGERGSASSAARLSRKSFSRDHNDENFVESGLGIRKSTSGAYPDQQGSAGQHSGTLSRTDSNSNNSVNSSSGGHPYPPPGYPSRHPDGSYGFPHPPLGMRPSGRMSVVVGGPPPSSRGPSKPSPAANRQLTHRHPGYTTQPGSYPPPGMSYPPPHGHHPHHPYPYHPHYAHGGAPPRHPHPSHMPMYGAQHPPHGNTNTSPSEKTKTGTSGSKPATGAKRANNSGSDGGKPAKKAKKSPGGKKKNKSPQLIDRADRQKAAQNIAAVNAASGGKNDKAAALAAAILRGVTMRPSGKWQAQLYFAGKSRYIGVFDTREKAALAYEIAREKLKNEKAAVEGALTPKQTENAVNSARQAAFDGVNEKDPRAAGK